MARAGVWPRVNYRTTTGTVMAYQPWSSTHTWLVLRVCAEGMKDRLLKDGERTERGGNLHSVRGRPLPLPHRTVPPLALGFLIQTERAQLDRGLVHYGPQAKSALLSVFIQPLNPEWIYS